MAQVKSRKVYKMDEAQTAVTDEEERHHRGKGDPEGDVEHDHGICAVARLMEEGVPPP